MKVPKGAVLRVCAWHELDTYTSSGWEFLDVLPYMDAETRTVSESWPMNVTVTSNGSGVSMPYMGSPATQNITKTVPVKGQRFLLWKNPESKIGELADKLRAEENSRVAAEHLLANVKAQVAALEKERNSLAQRLNALEKDLARQTADTARAVEERDKHECQSLVYEGQLAKVWIALGALQMEKLLGPDAVDPNPAPERLTAFQRLRDE